MIIPLSSNIVSAVHAISCDICLPFLVSFIISILLSSWNAKTLYRDKKSLLLKPNKLEILHCQGFSDTRTGNVVAVLATIIIVLGISAEFAITGITEDRRDTELAPIVVRGAKTSADLIDFTKHVSNDGIHVSGTYLLARDATLCARRGGKIEQFFAAKNNHIDLHTLQWEEGYALENSTCLMEDVGYEDVETLQLMNRMSLLLEGRRYFGFRKCKHKFTSRTSFNLTKADVNVTGDCPFTVHDSWCGNYVNNVCLLSIEHHGRFYIGSNRFNNSDCSKKRKKCVDIEYNRRYSNKKMDVHALRSLTYLVSTGVSGLRGIHYPMVSLSLYMDVEVKGRKRSSEVTHINEVVFALTVGLGAVILFALVIWALIFWMKNISGFRLKQYNRFYSLSDIFQYVSQDFQQRQENSMRLAKPAEKSLRIGVSRRVPYVGLLGCSDDEGNCSFPEHELEGTGYKRLQERIKTYRTLG